MGRMPLLIFNIVEKRLIAKFCALDPSMDIKCSKKKHVVEVIQDLQYYY